MFGGRSVIRRRSGDNSTQRFSLRRLSLRRQQLLFFAVVTAFVLLLIGIAIGVSAQYSQVFGTSLNRYFHIHEVRTGLSAIHDDLRHYLRSGEGEFMESVESRIPALEERWSALVGMEMRDRASLFEINASYYGLVAYREAARRAIREYRQQDEGYYFTLEYADRVRGYIDLYLERLFQIQLNRGRREYRSALSRQESIRWWTSLGILLVGGALSLFALLFSRSVTHPLERLVRRAHALASGDFDQPALDIPESEELREVALAFNAMSAGIRTLVGDLKDKHELERRLHQQELSNVSMERLLREAQLVALQSQVNPHFLFNTLNSIARTARLEGARGSETLIRELATVLRYVLRNPRRSVALDEELRVVRDYLALQQVRFGDRLDVDIDADPTTEGAQIPPLILQPLVENAIHYGIEPRPEGGTVWVHAREEGEHGRMTIEIGDNGVGMDATTVDHLLRDEPETGGESTKGIGVLNVRARLDLFFGAAQVFSLSSRINEGTVITIGIPLHREAETYGIHDSHRR